MKKLISLLLPCLVFAAMGPVSGSIIGVDAIHGFDADAVLTSGADFDTFRSAITSLGHTIVPLSSFEAQDLAGLDALILNQPYTQNAANYSSSEIAAVHSFVTSRAVFLSDSGLWSDDGAGSDRPITFGGNQLLLQNTVTWISGRGGLMVLADNGSGYQVGNINQLVASYGITYESSPSEGSGHTITGFVPHPVTAGLSSIGVDYQLRITTQSPAVDLTTGSGADNALSVAVVPEPSSILALLCGIGGLSGVMRRKRRK